MADMLEFAVRVSPESDDDGWEATTQLRIFGVDAVLEQEWRKPTFNVFGHLDGWERQWRAVPHIFGEDRGTR